MLRDIFRQASAYGILFTLVFTLVAAGSLLSASDNRGLEFVKEEVVVRPGDTLWTIAKNASPQHDPRDLVWKIRKTNGLDDSAVYPGQRLVVPTVKAETSRQ